MLAPLPSPYHAFRVVTGIDVNLMRLRNAGTRVTIGPHAVRARGPGARGPLSYRVLGPSSSDCAQFESRRTGCRTRDIIGLDAIAATGV